MIAKCTIVILITVALLGAVGAWAAGLSYTGTDDLGSGTADVLAPCGDPFTSPCPSTRDVRVTDVQWFLDLGGVCGDSSKVSLVRVTLDSLTTTTTFDQIRFQLTGAGGPLVHSSTLFEPITFNGAPGVTVDWDLSAAPTTPVGCVSASVITGFDFTVVDD